MCSNLMIAYLSPFVKIRAPSTKNGGCFFPHGIPRSVPKKESEPHRFGGSDSFFDLWLRHDADGRVSRYSSRHSPAE